MVKINKVAHVVLHASDFEKSVAFFRDSLEMEMVDYRKEVGRAFFSLGTQHHDIAVFEDKASYEVNADDPGQDKWYRELRANLEADPEWQDGEYVAGGLR